MSKFAIDYDFTSFEYTSTCLKTTTNLKLLVVIIYRTGNVTSLFMDELDLMLANVSSRCDYYIVAGDLNIHFERSTDNIVMECTDLLSSYGLSMNVTSSTHMSDGILDQIISSPRLISCVNIDKINRLSSDHFPVYCSIELEASKKFYKELVYRDIKNIDKTVFSDNLSLLTTSFTLSGCFRDSVKCLTQQCTELLDNQAPIVSKSIPFVTSAPWFDKEYRQLRTLRRKSEKRWRKTRLHIDYEL